MMVLRSQKNQSLNLLSADDVMLSGLVVKRSDWGNDR